MVDKNIYIRYIHRYDQDLAEKISDSPETLLTNNDISIIATAPSNS